MSRDIFGHHNCGDTMGVNYVSVGTQRLGENMLRCTREIAYPMFGIFDRLSIQKCGPMVAVLYPSNSSHLNRKK